MHYTLETTTLLVELSSAEEIRGHVQAYSIQLRFIFTPLLGRDGIDPTRWHLFPRGGILCESI